MAYGRQDYQAGVVPIKSGYSLTQTPFFKSEYYSVAASTSYQFIEYTVGVGYRLFVTGYRIVSNVSFSQTYRLNIDAVTQIRSRFDTVIVDNFPDNSPLLVNRGEKVWISITNDDANYHTFYVTLFGYLEQIAV